MYKDNDTNNKANRPTNASNGMERNNHSCIYQTIIKLITYELFTNTKNQLKWTLNISDIPSTYTQACKGNSKVVLDVTAADASNRYDTISVKSNINYIEKS